MNHNELNYNRGYQSGSKDTHIFYERKIDRIIAELESEVERWRESGEECNDNHDIAVSEGLKLALEIVRRGTT